MVVIISLLPIVAQQLLRSRDYILIYQHEFTHGDETYHTIDIYIL